MTKVLKLCIQDFYCSRHFQKFQNAGATNLFRVPVGMAKARQCSGSYWAKKPGQLFKSMLVKSNHFPCGKKLFPLLARGNRFQGEILPERCDLPVKVQKVLTEAGAGASGGE